MGIYEDFVNTKAALDAKRDELSVKREELEAVEASIDFLTKELEGHMVKLAQAIGQASEAFNNFTLAGQTITFGEDPIGTGDPTTGE